MAGIASIAHEQKVTSSGFGIPDTSNAIWQSQADNSFFARAEQIKLHYDRARSMCRASGMKIEDITTLSRRFWDFHLSPFNGRDAAAFTILTIHWNLCMGTLASHAVSRPDLQEVLSRLENFDLCGELMLTEVGHGLDARNLETTAHQQPDGSFILHTPTFRAAKSMPPTTPLAGVPKIAIVFARLIVADQDHGVKSFLVNITEDGRMCKGITAKLLPTRPGAKPVDHAVTFFNKVRLKPAALLSDLETADNQRLEFLLSIWRVAVGTLALSLSHVPCLDICAFIAARYSQRRIVGGPQPGQQVPIMHFKTQYQPILNALAHSHVFRSYAEWSISRFTDPGAQDWKLNHAVACIFKTTTQVTQQLVSELIERLGWQGLYGYNQLSEQMLSLKGNSVAEGDVLTLCIRLASELFQGKYSMPASRYPDSLLAQHEKSLLHAAQATIATFRRGHRDAEFNQQLSTSCRPYIEALGQRMAYEAALDSGARAELIDVYESYCVKADLAWYVENTHRSRAEYLAIESQRVEAALPLLEEILAGLDVRPAVTAPILTEERWRHYVMELPTMSASLDHMNAVKARL